MKFVVGLLTGVVVGAVGAVAYSVQSGRDLREAYEAARSELSKRELDQLGARVESAVSELQARMDAQIADVKARVEAATARGDATVTGAEEAASAAADGVATAEAVSAPEGEAEVPKAPLEVAADVTEPVAEPSAG